MIENISCGSLNNDSRSLDPEMVEIFESFLVESDEILEGMGRDVLELEKHPSDVDILNRIFRVAHTLKGTSGFLGYQQIADFAHVLEDLLNKLRKKEVAVNTAIIDIFFEAYDVLKELLIRVKKDNREPMELTRIMGKLGALIHGQELPESGSLSTLNAAAADEPQQTEIPGQQRAADTTVRVDVLRLDDLMNLVGELVLARNRFSQSAHHLVEEYETFAGVRDILESSQQIDFITTEIQMAVMKTRMVPVAKVFNKLPRLVRELSRDTGKEIDLQIYGKETELDKSIMEELNDPLIHIIRNAVDHGIESPDDRVRAQKPKQGTIIVNAEHDGNHIVISIEDDGRGMDVEVLKNKAVEKGIISDDRAREMSDREAFNLVFTPGFSTAETVTSISGRGVGMDIVRTNIAKLKGFIEIDSAVGRGTVLTLKLPLTLAIIQGLLVKASEEIFAIPLSSVVEVVRVRSSEFNLLGNRRIMRLRDSVVAVGRMSDVLGLAERQPVPEWSHVVVVGWSDQRFGIIVDEFLGQREIVIKSLGDLLGDIPAIGGSTILGDGRVILILDVGQFMRMFDGQETPVTKTLMVGESCS